MFELRRNRIRPRPRLLSERGAWSFGLLLSCLGMLFLLVLSARGAG